MRQNPTSDDMWIQGFRNQFERACRPPENARAMPMLIKIGPGSGCFHREHSPHAYLLIDDAVDHYNIPASGAVFEEHECGPEILMWLAASTAGIGLATSVINLVTAIVKCRTEGVHRGDDHITETVVTIRGLTTNNQFREKQILCIDVRKELDERRFHRQIDQAIVELFGDDEYQE